MLILARISGAFLILAAAASAQRHPIDVEKSTMTIRVDKAGLLSAFGHNHEIAAPVAGGSVDAGAREVELHVNAKALRVRDPQASEKDRAEIQRTMLGPEVLDAEKFPEIVFRSTAAQPAGPNVWKVEGKLTLHGETRPVSVEVRDSEGRYVGTARLKQTDFGMKPIKAAGGTVRVKDEVRIEFAIQVAR